MKLLITISLLLILSAITFGQGRGIELTRDNPSTLVSTNSANYTIFGFKLGMTRPEAQKVLATHKLLAGQQDAFNLQESTCPTEHHGDRRARRSCI
jgi:hypothetical protein